MDPKVYNLLIFFFKRFGKKSYPKEKVFIKPEDKKIFFLTKGVVRMFNPKDRRDITLNIHREGSLFPMFPIFGIRSSYAYESLTEAEGYFSKVLDFKKFLDKNPLILLDLLKRIYLGFDGFYRMYETLLFGDAYTKVLTSLIIHARRFGKKENGVINFDWNLTHRRLASQTGLARESVTKEIKKLQDKKLVEYRGRKMIIFDLLKLENESFSHLTS